MNIVNFLANNAIWCIIGAVIFVMAIIGYLAENSEFGKSILHPKKTKVEKRKKKEDKPFTIEEAKEKLKQSDKKIADKPDNEMTDEAKNDTIFSNDDWSNDTNTNFSQPEIVSSASPDEWLNNPVISDNENFDNEMDLDSYNLSEIPVEPVNNYDKSQDALYDMPHDYIEQPIIEPANQNYSNVEILNEEKPFENVEILDGEKQFENNEASDEKKSYENVEILDEEKSNENNSDDFWK